MNKKQIEEKNNELKKQYEFINDCLECDEEIIKKLSKKELCEILSKEALPKNFIFDRHQTLS